MKKFLTIFLLSCATMMYAQNDYFINLDTQEILGDTICMPYNGTLHLQYHNSDLGYFDWIPFGDLTISAQGDIAEVTSTDYGKGAIRIKATSCSTVRMLYIFKDFTPEDNLVISGPECISEGDTVVFSIDPILTKNLDANIGFDKYYWNIYTEDKPNCVSNILYKAGDGSSVTFVVGELSDRDTLKVNLGYCNQNDDSKAIKLPLLKKAPAPDVVSDTCISYGEQEITLHIKNPVYGVNYSWILPTDYTEVKLEQTYATIRVDAEVSAKITVIASYNTEEDGGCADTPAYINIHRSFNTDASISHTNADCFTIGEQVEFKVKEGAPKSATFNWVPMQNGWDTISKNFHGSSITFSPTENVPLENIFSVTLDPCNDTILYDTIYVKPATIPLENIVLETGNEYECLDQYQTVKAYIRDWSSIKPQGDSIIWSASNSQWTITYGVTPDTAYIYVANIVENPMISVFQVGLLSNCNGDTTYMPLNYFPSFPEELLSRNGCIASNMPDYDTVYITNPVIGQTYEWQVSTHGEIVEYFDNTSLGVTHCGIRIKTDGTPDSNIQVTAWAHNEECGNSITTSLENPIYIPEYSNEIIYNSSQDFYSVDGRHRDAEFYWYVLYNGELYDGSIWGSNNSSIVYLSTENWDIQNSTEYTLVCEMIEDKCKRRITYGASISPSLSINASPNKRKINRLQSNDFVVSPNPAQNTITLTTNNTRNLQENKFVILNESGMCVLTGNKYEFGTPINISGLQQGVYIIAVKNNNFRASQTFIIK